MSKHTRPVPWWQRVLYVLAWPVSAALVLVDLAILREAALDLLTWIGVHRGTRSAEMRFAWLVETLDWVLILLLATVGVALAVTLEYYLRKGLALGKFTVRLARVLGILAGLAVLGLLARALI